MLLLRLNLEGEVTAGLLLRVFPASPANGFRTCNMLSDVTWRRFARFRSRGAVTYAMLEQVRR